MTDPSICTVTLSHCHSHTHLNTGRERKQVIDSRLRVCLCLPLSSHSLLPPSEQPPGRARKLRPRVSLSHTHTIHTIIPVTDSPSSDKSRVSFALRSQLASCSLRLSVLASSLPRASVVLSPSLNVSHVQYSGLNFDNDYKGSIGQLPRSPLHHPLPPSTTTHFPHSPQSRSHLFAVTWSFCMHILFTTDL